MTGISKSRKTTQIVAILWLITFALNAFQVCGQESPQQPGQQKTPDEIELDQEIRILELKKKKAKLEQEIRESLPAPSTTPLEGKTTLNDKVTMEAEIVTYIAMTDAAFTIGDEIASNAKDANCIVIYNPTDVRDWRFYQALAPAFKLHLDDIINGYKREFLPPSGDVLAPPPPLEEGPQELLFSGTSLLRSFVDLISIFRTDTDITGVPVTIDQNALAAETMRALRLTYKTVHNRDITLYNPSVITPRVVEKSQTLAKIEDAYKYKAMADQEISDFDQESNKLKELKQVSESLGKKIEEADAAIKENQETIKANNRTISRLQGNPRNKEKIKQLRKENLALENKIKELEADKLAKATEKEKRNKEATALEAQLKPLKEKAARLKALNERYEKFINEFVKIDPNTGTNAFTLFIKSENLDEIFKDPKSFWLEIKSVKAGGNNRVRRNLIRYLSGSKVDHSGGVVIEYALYDRKGAAVLSDKYSKYEWYTEPKKINERSELAEGPKKNDDKSQLAEKARKTNGKAEGAGNHD